MINSPEMMVAMQNPKHHYDYILTKRDKSKYVPQIILHNKNYYLLKKQLIKMSVFQWSLVPSIYLLYKLTYRQATNRSLSYQLIIKIACWNLKVIKFHTCYSTAYS